MYSRLCRGIRRERSSSFRRRDTPSAGNNGFPESSGRQDRRRRRRLLVGEQSRSPGAAPSARPGDHRPEQGSVFHEESPGLVRVQAVSDSAQQRGQLSGAYAGQEASGQLGQESGEGGQGGAADPRAGEASGRAEEVREDRSAWLPGHQTARSGVRPAEPAVSGGLPGGGGQCDTAAQVYVRLRAKGRATGSQVAVSAVRG